MTGDLRHDQVNVGDTQCGLVSHLRDVLQLLPVVTTAETRCDKSHAGLLQVHGLLDCFCCCFWENQDVSYRRNMFRVSLVAIISGCM